MGPQWVRWKRVNADKMKHIANYEEKFVDLVLSQIPMLSPGDIIAQYQFQDRKGIKRRIDFMIINPSKGYLLPIELDGHKKTEEAPTSADWTDFLERQNAIVASFGTILRFSNLKMLNSPAEVIRQVSEALAIQTADKAANDSRSSVIERLAAASVQPVLSPVPPPHIAKAPVTTGRHSSNLNHLVWMTVALVAGVLLMLFMRASSLHRDGARNKEHVSHTPMLTVPVPFPGQLSEQSPLATDQPQQVVPIVDRSADLLQAASSEESGDVGGDSWTWNVPNEGRKNDQSIGQVEPGPISTKHAEMAIGQVRTVCGYVAMVREISAGTFINFDDAYPNESVSAVIWKAKAASVGSVDFLPGQTTCIKGKIEAYRGKPRIEILDRDQILK